MKFQKKIKINKEKISSYFISFIITFVIVIIGWWILNKIQFFERVTKTYLILAIFLIEFLLFFIVIQKIIFQYFLYRKKIFGQMFKYKIIIYVVLNLGIIFFIFTSFMIYFNFNSQRRLNYYTINESLEITYSNIINLISNDKKLFESYSKTLSLELEGLKKISNNKNKFNRNNIFVFYKNSIKKNKNNIIDLIERYKLILLVVLTNDSINLKNGILYSDIKFGKLLNDLFEYGNQLSLNKKSVIKNIKSIYFVFVKTKRFLFVYYPDQEIYKLNEKIYPGYKTFKSEFSIFKYTPILYILYFIFLFIPLLFIQIFFTISFIDKLNKPLKVLLTGFERFDEIHFNKLQEFKIKDEFYFLINKFNLMQKELNKNQIYRRYKDRYEIYKMVTTKFAHEIKNPLTPITLSAQLIRRKYPYDDEFKDYLNKKIDIIVENSGMIKNIIEKIYNFSDMKKEENIKFNLFEFLNNLRTTWESNKIKINLEMNSNFDICIKGSMTDFYSVFNNLIINSINASEGKCNIKISVFVDMYAMHKKKINKNETNNGKLKKISENINATSVKNHKMENINIKDINIENIEIKNIIIDYYDNGPGIPKEIKKFVFEPFFTTNVNGSGLGLAIVKSTVEKYNGLINYISDFNGAHFRIIISNERKIIFVCNN